MARLILHVGTHKTGTTAIQSFLARSRPWLEANGAQYPDTRVFAGANPDLQHVVASAIARPGPFSAPLERFRDQLRRALARGGVVIVSSEVFYRSVTQPNENAPEFRPEDFWPQREAYLDRMAECFAGMNPEILIYFRNPVSLAESLYANNVMVTSRVWDFEGYLAGRTFMFDFARHLDAFEARFPVVRARSFDRVARAGLLTGFCADAGLPPPDPQADRPFRTAVANRAVLWMRRAKAEGGVSALEQRRRWRFALVEDGRQAFAEPAPSSFWRDGAQRAAFFETYGRPVAGIAFAPPEGPAPPRTVWDDAMHAAAEAAYADWTARNADMLRARERAGLQPFQELSDLSPARAGESRLARGARRLRGRWRRLTGG
jgi:hypothetical protein